LTNATADPATVTYTITPSAGGCTGLPVNVVVTVNPIPEVTASPLSQSVCSGGATAITLSSLTPGTTFTWTAALTSGTATGFADGTGSSIAQTLTNASTDPATVTYTITPSAGGCTGLPVNVVVTINPIPEVTASPLSQSVCSGGITAITLSSLTPGTTFTWTAALTSGTASGFLDGTGSSIAQVLSNITGAPATVTYTITPAANECSGPPVDVTITVNPLPVLSADLPYQQICPGSDMTPVNLTSSIPGTTFTWIRDNTGVLTGMPDSGSGSTISGTLDSSDPQVPLSTTFTVTGTTPEGCFSVITVTVEIFDNTDPLITCPANIIVNADAGFCYASGVDLGSPVVTDQCEVTLTNNAPAIFPIGVTNVTWTATDRSGNNVSCNQTVTVIDNQVPTIVCPVDIVTSTNSGCTAINVPLGVPITTDNCNSVFVTNSAPSSYPLGTTTVVWTVTDAAGNTATCEQKVTVTDNTPPMITCPANIAVTTTALCSATVADLGTPTAADNCGPVTVTHDAPAEFPLGTTTVTWTATDGSGNTAICTQTVTVTDIEKPVITCPADFLAPADPGLCRADGIILTAPTATDNCGIASITSDAPASFPVGSTTVTWTARDNSGNTATCTQIVIISDTEKPTISCPPLINATTTPGLCGAPGVALGIPVASDNCGVDEITNDAPAVFPVGSTTVTYTVTDIHGNSSTCTQVVVVTDNEIPSITCAADISVSADAGSCSATGVVLVPPTVSDNCGVAGYVNNAPATFLPGINTVTWTVTDIHGNTATCEQKVTVTDNELPTITCPGDIAVSADTDACEASGVALGTPVTADNCGIASTTHDAPPVFPLGITTVTWTVTDTGGNVATCTQTVTVTDITPPVPDLSPLPDVIGDVCSPTTVNPPTATDNCGPVTATTSDAVTFTDAGTYTINWVYTDPSGNTSVQTQTVIIESESDPVPVIPNLPVIRAQCDTTITIYPQAVSSCLDTITGYTNDPLNYSVQGTYTITWIYDDGGGKITTQTQSVIIKDTRNPFITCQGDVTQPADPGACQAFVNIPPVLCADNCGCLGITNDYNSGGGNASGIYPKGTTIVTFIATDLNGNTSNCSIAVTVTDGEFPVIACPAGITVIADPVTCNAQVTIPAVTFSDNCPGVVIANDFNSGGADASGTYPIGTTVVTFTATDASGNSSTCQVTIIVEDHTTPTADPLPDLGPFQCYNDIPAPDINYLTNVRGSCGPVSIIHLSTGGDPGCSGTVVRIYRLTGSNGATADISQNILISDNTPPTANPLPQAGPFDCYSNVPAGNINDVTGETDNCGGSVTVTYLGTDPDPGCSATISRRYLLEDVCGNQATIIQQIVINDQLAPVLTGIPSNALVSCSSIPDPPDLYIDITATDNCDTSPVITFSETRTQTNFGICTDYAFTIIRTWTAEDNCGHKTSRSQTITITDDIDPTITVAGTMTFECGENLDPDIIGYPTFSDNCDPNPTLTYTDVTVTTGCANELSVVRTWIVTDACGNSTSAVQFFVIEDQTPPTFVNFPPDITVSCPDDIPETMNTLSAIDNCGTGTVILISESYLGLDNKPGFCPSGVVRVYRATDACGNFVDRSHVITVAGECGCSICQTVVPHDFVDLSTNPDTTWVSAEFKRNGKCCESAPNSECASFTVQLHPDAVSIYVQDIQAPSYGSEEYQLNCGTIGVFGREICVQGGTIIVITICKPGKEKQQISIQQLSGVMDPGVLDARVNCEQTATMTGNVDESSIVWRDITGGGAYNRYLSCLAGCYDNTFTPDSLAPSIVQYEVCGTIAGSECLAGGAICDTITFRVYPKIDIIIDGDLDFCEGGAGTITITPTPLGLYNIILYDGPDGTGNIIANVNSTSYSFIPTADGDYSVSVIDNTTGLGCNTDNFNFTISISPFPVFDLGLDRGMCFGDTVVLDLPDDFTYNWLTTTGVTPGADPSVFILSPPLGSFSYTVIATNAAGCTFSEDLTVTVVNCIVCPGIQTSCPQVDFLLTTVSEFTAIGGDVSGYPCNVSDTNIELIDSQSDGQSCPETITQLYGLWDDCGNYDTCEITIIRDDLVPPVVSDPGDITVEGCDETMIMADGRTHLPYSSSASVITLAELAAEGISATDDCGIRTIIYRDSAPAGICQIVVIRTFTVTDECNNSTTVDQVITIEDTTPPVFTVPAGITISCDANRTDLTLTGDVTDEYDECDSTLDATFSDVTNSADPCAIVITRTWTLTDDCGNTTTQIQTITVDPPPVAVFLAPPPDDVLTCAEAITYAVTPTDLSYSNGNGTAACLIEGTVTGVIAGAFDECGGTLTQTWTFTDICNRTITHVQTITVEPALPAVFIDAPSDGTITCADAISYSVTPVNLAYSNGAGTGACLIEGEVTGVIAGTFDECGGALTQTWTYTDDCGRTITHVQNITVEPALPAVFINPPTDDVLTCAEAITYSATAVDLSYSNNDGTGACLIEGTVPGVVAGTFDECGGALTQTWTFTDDCGRTITHVQNITVEPALPAVFINPPADDVLTCAEAITYSATAVNLSYSNNDGAGACLIEGTVPGTIAGTFDECGGALTQTWTFTDDCGRTITHVQNITVEPALPAIFINPPIDDVLTCAEAITYSATPASLAYSNNDGTGACLIEGNVPGVISRHFR
jgi:hypothetical protein